MASGQDVDCRHCKRTYSRPEHLQRHLLSHALRSPYQCSNCQRAFKRKDVLNRHLTTCSSRLTSSILSHNRACHRCSNKKRKCSHDRPSCRACTKAGVICRYPNDVHSTTQVSHDADLYTASSSPLEKQSDRRVVMHAEETIEMHSSHVQAATRCQLLADDSSSVGHSPLLGASLQVCIPSTPCCERFSFLPHFTTRYGLKDSFGTVSSIHTLVSDTLPSTQTYSFGERWESPLPFSATATVSSVSSTLEIISCTPESARSYFATLGDKASEYLASCRIHATMGPILQRNGKQVKRSSFDLFAPNTLAYSLGSYWSNWHPNWPVLHKPTFSMTNTPTPLLAAMIVVGSCYENIDIARDWFDAVENLAFEELSSISPSATPYQKIKAIQAAYLVCIFQTWDGGTEARRRIRRCRFGSIVTAVRDLDMSTFNHGDVATCLEHFDWIEFVRMEECIRTLLWVFQLDTAYIIFNNMPPNFALRELSMGLASPEMSFQASSPHECFNILRAWLAHNGRIFDATLYGLIRTFFKQKLDGDILNSLAHESFMNLWCVDAAFHVILFNLDPVLGGRQQFTSLERGIDNWQMVWNQRMMNNDERFFDAIVATESFGDLHENMKRPWQCPGFWKNAAEYWLLARVTLKRMSASHESATAADELSGCTALHVNVSSHIHDRIEDGEMRSLHSFLAAVGNTILA